MRILFAFFIGLGIMIGLLIEIKDLSKFDNLNFTLILHAIQLVAYIFFLGGIEGKIRGLIHYYYTGAEEEGFD